MILHFTRISLSDTKKMRETCLILHFEMSPTRPILGLFFLRLFSNSHFLFQCYTR